MHNLIVPFVMLAFSLTVLRRVESVLVVGIFFGLNCVVTFRHGPVTLRATIADLIREARLPPQEIRYDGPAPVAG